MNEFPPTTSNPILSDPPVTKLDSALGFRPENNIIGPNRIKSIKINPIHPITLADAYNGDPSSDPIDPLYCIFDLNELT